MLENNENKNELENIVNYDEFQNNKNEETKDKKEKRKKKNKKEKIKKVKPEKKPKKEKIKKVKDKKKIDKIDKKIKKYKSKSYLKIEDFTVINEGVKNKYDETLTISLNTESKLKKLKKKNKNGSNDVYINATKEQLVEDINKLKEEEEVFKEEIKQIKKLNYFSKGNPKLKNKEGNIIDVININKIYTSKRLIFHALKNANVSFKKGSFNVILGPSGSGKTTLLNMISGLDRATYGDIIINDINISCLTNRQVTQFRRKYIGFVFQSYNLLPSLNVSDNIDVGRSLQVKKKERRNIDELLQEIELGGSDKKRVYELSGGQQQRVSIARALSKSPSILIGDEPTGALDQNTSLKVMRLFQEINREKETTIIIVTHNPNIARLADQVIYVKDGRIDKIVKQKAIDARDIKEI